MITNFRRQGLAIEKARKYEERLEQRFLVLESRIEELENSKTKAVKTKPKVVKK